MDGGWVRTYGVGDHDGEHRAVPVVGIELPHQDGDHGELDDEDYGVEEGLFTKRKRTRSALVHSQLRSSVCLCFTETSPRLHHFFHHFHPLDRIHCAHDVHICHRYSDC